MIHLDAKLVHTNRFETLQQKNSRKFPRASLLVVVVRERDTNTFVGKSEAAGVAAVRACVDADAVIQADEASHWDVLHGSHVAKRINHSVCYSDGTACTNQAESFFSRLRRAEVGVHHHIAGPYLNAYAGEMAWREDNRREANGTQAAMVTRSAMCRRYRASGRGIGNGRLKPDFEAPKSYALLAKDGSDLPTLAAPVTSWPLRLAKGRGR